MKYNFQFLLFWFCFTQILSAQNKSIDSIVTSLQQDQLLFEKIFIHTNKTNYVNEDVIWFKTYVATKNNKPSLKTALVYVSLFSQNGALINTKNVYVKDGVGNNQFELDDELVGGKYYIQAHTNNMLNFGVNNKFITEIIIGENFKNNTTSKTLYDIQLFPEGGYFLEGVKNGIGVKALINGKGVDYKGKIVNSKNEEVALFSSMHLGMSKSRFRYEHNENYKAIIEINDTIINKKLPKSIKDGVAISKKDSNNEVISFEILTNKNANRDKYVLLFHQNNSVIDYVNVSFKDTKKKIFVFNKTDFLKGVNTVTVLKNNQPFLERKFFVNGKINNEFSIENINKLEDSIIYKLNIKDISAHSNISLSVLSSSSNYSSNTDMASAMCLTPYVKGYIEKPSFYFNKENGNREAYLDLLLLTQGWTQFTQKEFVEKLNPKSVYDFEKGFVLKGDLSPVLTNNLGIFTTDNKLITRQFLNSQTSFSFNNLVAYKGDSIKLAFIDREVLRRQPKMIKYDSISVKEDKISHVFYNQYSKKSENIEKINDETTTKILSYKPQNGIVSLETVDLKTKKKSKAFDSKYKKKVFDIGGYYELEIPEKYKIKDLTLENYLLRERSYAIKQSNYGMYLTNGNRLIVMTLDGKSVFPSRSGIPIEIVLNIDMNYIEAVSFQPGLASTKIDLVAVFTTDHYKNRTTNNFKTYLFKDGYSKSKKYYVPLFLINTDITNQEIDWKPNLISNTNGDIVFKLKDNLDYENLLFSIQGFSNDGELISGFYKLENTKTK